MKLFIIILLSCFSASFAGNPNIKIPNVCKWVNGNVKCPKDCISKWINEKTIICANKPSLKKKVKKKKNYSISCTPLDPKKKFLQCGEDLYRLTGQKEIFKEVTDNIPKINDSRNKSNSSTEGEDSEERSDSQGRSLE